MTRSRYTIRRHYLHVEFNGTEADGLAIQHRLPGLCSEHLLPAIEQVLAHFAPAEGDLCFERIDLDAGRLTLEFLEHDLAAAVAQALKKFLRERLSAGGAAPGLAESVTYKTRQQSITEALVYFLHTGSLPWSFHLPAGRTLEQVILSEWQEAAQSGPDQIVQDPALRQVLRETAGRQRLVRQFSRQFLQTLLARLSPPAVATITRVLQTLSRTALPPVAEKQFTSLLWETALAGVAVGQGISAASLLDSARELAAASQPALMPVLERHWPHLTRQTPDPGESIPGADQVLAATATPASLSAEAASIPDHQPPEVQETSMPGSTLSTPGKEAHEISLSGPTPLSPGTMEHPEVREGLYIDNAGLVLLHPFLPQFFRALDIAVDDILLKPERALCLLHFLTTGQTRFPEYELVLPKILCTIPLTTPVDTDLELTGLEREETNALLEAVIRHWEALRHTSPDGLRGTFLVRPGKVTRRDDGDWLLQVEASAFDILLDQLPWGISPVKLPWMPYLLWVEWR